MPSTGNFSSTLNAAMDIDDNNITFQSEPAYNDAFVTPDIFDYHAFFPPDTDHNTDHTNAFSQDQHNTDISSSFLTQTDTATELTTQAQPFQSRFTQVELSQANPVAFRDFDYEAWLENILSQEAAQD